jgi:hypothetical protein
MKPEKQLKIGIILMFIVFVIIYGTYILFKLSEDNLVILIGSGITGGIGIFIIIIQAKRSRTDDSVKSDMSDIREGVLDVRENLITFKDDQIEMKSDILELKKKVDGVVIMITDKELEDAKKDRERDKRFMFLEKGYNELKNEIEK